MTSDAIRSPGLYAVLGFYTNDGGLAQREGLAGDFHNGWHGSAPLVELTDVVETVTSLQGRPS